jgi:hypothetical protein
MKTGRGRTSSGTVAVATSEGSSKISAGMDRVGRSSSDQRPLPSVIPDPMEGKELALGSRNQPGKSGPAAHESPPVCTLVTIAHPGWAYNGIG